MALLTYLARSRDGLPLSASTPEDEPRDLAEYQQRAKKILRKLSPQSPSKCTIESPPLVFHYIIEGGVCYLALCETTYPPHLAFTYLEAVHNEFIEQYGQRINKAQRPYHFVEFSTSLSKIKRNYLDVPSRRTSQLRSLGDELHGVQRIMFDNVDAVLQRGEMISEISSKADALVVGSKRFRNQATLLNLRTSLAAKLAIGVVIFLIIVFLKFWFF